MGKIEFNKEYANKVSETQWLKDHDHYKEVIDLKEVYKSLQEPKEKEKKKEEK